MGAWGAGNFENDTALDYLNTIVEAKDLAPLENTFDTVLAQQDYIDADTACEAIAAGEIIALLRGHPAANIPEYIVEWQQTHNHQVQDELVQKAIRAVEKTTSGSEQSELYELWEETDDLLQEWKAAVSDLLQRLRL